MVEIAIAVLCQATKFAFMKKPLELSGVSTVMKFQVEASILVSLKTVLIQTIPHGRIYP
jgi:hypothetical protein